MSPLLGSAWALAERLGGKPKVLFTFVIGSRMWRYAQSGADVTVAATDLTYKAAHIQVDGDVDRRDDYGPQNIPVRIGIRADVVDAIRSSWSEQKYLAIHRYHASAGGIPARWAYGAIVNVRLVRGWCLFTLQTEEANWDNLAPRAIFAPQCQKDTYSPECMLDMNDFATSCNVTATSGESVTVDSVAGNPDDFFSFGLLKIGNNFWHVPKQTGTALRIFGNLPRGLALPAAATLFAGDDLTHETCRDKFDNLVNFLGFKWLPTSNPLDDLERHGSPPALIAPVLKVPPIPGYTTPAKWGFWNLGGVLVDGLNNVQTWTDSSGNGRDLTQSSATERPGFGLDAGLGNVVGFGPATGDQQIGHNGGGISDGRTGLRIPDMSALTTADIFIAFNSSEEPPLASRCLHAMHGSGASDNSFIIHTDDSISDGTGLDSGGGSPLNYKFPISLRNGRHVINWTLDATRWIVRLDGVVVFTTTPLENDFTIGFNSTPTLGFDDLSLHWRGYCFGMVIYPSALDETDRATTLAYLQTGTGSPA